MDPQNIWRVTEQNFKALALDIFRFQYHTNLVYQAFCNTLNVDPVSVTSIEKIPFLPIQFFKSHEIVATSFEPHAIFESSGTTGATPSRHYVKDLEVYRTSFTTTFRRFYGAPADWCIMGLLPSYLERKNSSLVLMVDELVQQSCHPESGFYLSDFERLKDTIEALEQRQQKTLLVGVTFALLDFAETNKFNLNYTIVMETGGMKGRRRELTRAEVHELLSKSFGVDQIHSEYGMTELLSQAYSGGGGRFACPPWMKVFIREEDDPFAIHPAGDSVTSGAANIIDLANLYSCSFIATDDAAKLHPDGSFEVLGRLDSSDVRGCSLLSV